MKIDINNEARVSVAAAAARAEAASPARCAYPARRVAARPVAAAAVQVVNRGCADCRDGAPCARCLAERVFFGGGMAELGRGADLILSGCRMSGV